MYLMDTLYQYQGPTGRCFRLRDGSGSGIGKNFGFGFGYGSGSGIANIYMMNRVLSGIQNLDRVFLNGHSWAFFRALYDHFEALFASENGKGRHDFEHIIVIKL